MLKRWKSVHEIPFLKSSEEILTIRAKKNHLQKVTQNRFPFRSRMKYQYMQKTKNKKPQTLLIWKAELETYAITYALKWTV